MNVKDLPPHERPRERLSLYGPEKLANIELLAILLQQGNKKEPVLTVAQRILNSHDLPTLSRIRSQTLQKLCGIGEAKAAQIIAAFELGRRAARTITKKTTLESAEQVAKRFIPYFQHLKKEQVIGLYLDVRKRIIKEEVLFVGTLNGSVVQARDIFKVALDEGAAAVVILHNHPSGDPEPSDEDLVFTEELILAGKIIGVEVLDHIIIGGENHFSFKEHLLSMFESV